MATNQVHIAAVNAGSSSIKISLFALGGVPEKIAEAAIENIGQSPANLVERIGTAPAKSARQVDATNHAAATEVLVNWLKQQVPQLSIVAIGHRIVHGGPNFYKSQVINDQMLVALRELRPFDPEHLPVEIQLIQQFQTLFQGVRQVACFDTAFHHGLPTVARMLPIPRHFEAKGVRRYGFHGLSYAFILEELRRIEGNAAANGKVIIAHLGSGASLAAVLNGKPVDTTMGLTPASGIPMSTRSGDLDPGLVLYLARTHGYNADQFNRMANFESGLLGISETTADMEKLLKIESEDERAKDAVDIFCYQVTKNIGSLAAALGGLNTLVFTGGMGENAPKVRARVCDNLEFLGITLDSARNQEGQRLISADGSRVGVHVIHTDESITIAHEVTKFIKQSKQGVGYESS